MGTKIILTAVAVTIASGAATGSSAANPALVPGRSLIVGFFPTGVATSTGFGLVDTVTLNADGSVTVTTRANVATQNLTMSIVVATPINKD